MQASLRHCNPIANAALLGQLSTDVCYVKLVRSSNHRVQYGPSRDAKTIKIDRLLHLSILSYGLNWAKLKKKCNDQWLLLVMQSLRKPSKTLLHFEPWLQEVLCPYQTMNPIPKIVHSRDHSILLCPKDFVIWLDVGHLKFKWRYYALQISRSKNDRFVNKFFYVKILTKLTSDPCKTSDTVCVSCYETIS